MDKKILIWSLAILVLIILYSAFSIDKSAFLKQQDVITEAKITKLVSLSIKPGEEYLYTFNLSGNSSFSMLYQIKKGVNCTAILLTGVINQTFVCVNPISGNDKSGFNSSLNSSYFYIFSPWMLAVNDSWKWNYSTSSVVGSNSINKESVILETISQEQVLGRDTYKIKLTYNQLGSFRVIYEWIDIKKRILVKEESSDYIILLSNAPFPLEQ